MKKNVIERAKVVLEIESQAILAMQGRLGPAFEEAVQLIQKCEGKLIVTGIGKSGQIARKIASTFSSTGTPALYLHPAESSHGDLGVITKDDIVLALSYGGESPEMVPILAYLARKGNPLIAMTGSPKSTLGQAARAVLDVSVSREACPLSLAPTASSTASLAMGDALAMTVMEQKGFSTEQFAEYHPGGKLGFRLSRVGDNMHTGPGFILVSEETALRKVFSEMSRNETRGAAGIVDSQGHLLGIITDGDIRRRLETSPDPVAGLARDMMTKNPRTIDANEIAEKALFLMEQFRINVLFVLDASSASPKKPVGVIHIQDLLKSKVR
ncbi:MAG: D-arabinose 5-phosphate isomerase [Bdellovibrio sp. CG10_big_fil_rev_8_21_14_0_10_47_8]|nr:MAG: D-arabinose 5-phosphate isomerase [Bdellovibrio sp. CG10_big_fil_rev_8_21_14_0_10_47_8]